MIDVTVAYATPSQQMEISLSVEESCTVEMAVKRSGICAQFDEIQLGQTPVGINGKRSTLDAPLQAGDRVEFYRPLVIDPKDARRLRVGKRG